MKCPTCFCTGCSSTGSSISNSAKYTTLSSEYARLHGYKALDTVHPVNKGNKERGSVHAGTRVAQAETHRQARG